MNFQNKKAIYLQIIDFICEQILLNEWQGRIPSVRELAVSLEVNPNTVLRAYAFLEEKKIILLKRGTGYFLDEKAFQHAKAFKKKEFMAEELPNIFKSMELLDISLEDFQQLYKEKNKHEKK